MPVASLNELRYSVHKTLDAAVTRALADWTRHNGTRRLWERDAALWSNSDEAGWLGWLDSVRDLRQGAAALSEFGADVRKEKFTHALLLGMGGSSLCPEVLAMTFGWQFGSPELLILDSTDPGQVKAVEDKIDLARTLFLVASKSGSTLEPNIFKQYFFQRAKDVVGAEQAGSRFVAITDPGSKMEQVARQDGFRRIYFGVPSIGGRYSALSHFGMVPAAVMGLNVEEFLTRTADMVEACKLAGPAEQNPGVLLGVVLGVAARSGRDKLTIVTTPGVYDVGAWLEQLIAESTGKDGKGIIPVDRERLAPPARYGQDRVFAYIRHAATATPEQDQAVAMLEAAGHPVIRIELNDLYNLGQEFFRWEIATAVAGSLLGINPFNQPDVEASKVETRKLTSAYEATGSLPPESPFSSEGEIRLFADGRNSAELQSAAGGDQSLSGLLRAHLKRISAEKGDYFALLAYIEMNVTSEAHLQEIRHAVRDATRAATCLGFGPRFLHSTGQAYKGGPNSGVFLQVTCDDSADLAVPGQKYSFGVVKAAQARGDFDVLAARHRRALRVHLGKDVESGLRSLAAAMHRALAGMV